MEESSKPGAILETAHYRAQDFKIPALKNDTAGGSVGGYKIIGNEHYLEKKKKRPLSLSSIKDLRLVKEDLLALPSTALNDNAVESPSAGKSPKVNQHQNNIRSIMMNKTPVQSDEKKRLRTLVLASAALAKFRQHATAKRKEKKINFSGSITPRPGGGGGGLGGGNNSFQTSIKEGKRLSIIEVDELFESMACRRYSSLRNSFLFTFSYDCIIRNRKILFSKGSCGSL